MKVKLVLDLAFTHQDRRLEEELLISTKESFIKLTPQKGSLEVDFGKVDVLDNRKRIRVHAFCAKLSYSKVECIQVYPS